MTILKCVRELLFNVLKHAETLQAVVRMIYGDGKIQIAVLDQGKGCGQLPLQGSTGQSFGLASVKQRLALVGRRLDIVSRTGAGTCATLIVPYVPTNCHF